MPSVAENSPFPYGRFNIVEWPFSTEMAGGHEVSCPGAKGHLNNSKRLGSTHAPAIHRFTVYQQYTPFVRQ